MFAQILRKLAHLTKLGRFEEDFDAEIQFHLETRIEALEREGLSKEQAQPRLAGNSGPAPEQVRKRARHGTLRGSSKSPLTFASRSVPSRAGRRLRLPPSCASRLVSRRTR